MKLPVLFGILLSLTLPVACSPAYPHDRTAEECAQAGEMENQFISKCLEKDAAEHGTGVGSASKTASSQRLNDPQYCANRIFDVDKIIEYVEDGAPKEMIIGFAKGSRELGPERLAAIMIMIEEAYAVHGDMTSWRNQKLEACQL